MGRDEAEAGIENEKCRRYWVKRETKLELLSCSYPPLMKMELELEARMVIHVVMPINLKAGAPEDACSGRGPLFTFQSGSIGSVLENPIGSDTNPSDSEWFGF